MLLFKFKNITLHPERQQTSKIRLQGPFFLEFTRSYNFFCYKTLLVIKENHQYLTNTQHLSISKSFNNIFLISITLIIISNNKMFKIVSKVFKKILKTQI